MGPGGPEEVVGRREFEGVLEHKEWEILEQRQAWKRSQDMGNGHDF